MVNRIDHNTSRDPRSLRDSTDIRAKSSARPYSQHMNSVDDVIASLANAPENRRARQVTEWERMRRQTFPQAA